MYNYPYRNLHIWINIAQMLFILIGTHDYFAVDYDNVNADLDIFHIGPLAPHVWCSNTMSASFV